MIPSPLFGSSVCSMRMVMALLFVASTSATTTTTTCAFVSKNLPSGNKNIVSQPSSCNRNIATRQKLFLEEEQHDTTGSSISSNSASGDGQSRRTVLGGMIAGAGTSALGTIINPNPAFADESVYVPAKRPNAYLVDSTIPPTLLPLGTAQKQTEMLLKLGKGFGTNKEAIFIDRVNLNNIMNKAVFGAIRIGSNAVTKISGNDDYFGPGIPDYASFVCLGVPTETKPKDINLVISLLDQISKPRSKKLGFPFGAGDDAATEKTNTALGLAFAPLSTQPILDKYLRDNSNDAEAESALTNGLMDAGVDSETVGFYLPLLRDVKKKNPQTKGQLLWSLLALAPEGADAEIARKEGLQYVDPVRRSSYVVDSKGFIELAQDPAYKLYTDRSLLKDYSGEESGVRGFFAERILVHETAATIVAKFAVNAMANANPPSNGNDEEQPKKIKTKDSPLVVVVAPIRDLRYMKGINGRIPRICNYLSNASSSSNESQSTDVINENFVTTILCNPSAKETLSMSNYLRLEIGTGPDTLQYQTKVADYFWFSESPKVNMLARLME